MTRIKDFRVNVRLFNNQMRERRERLGLSASAFCEMHGVDYATYIYLESLKRSPLTSGRGGFGKAKPITWTPTAIKVAKALGAEPETLWPDAVLDIERREGELRVDAEQMAALISPPDPLSPDRLLAAEETNDALKAALGCLSKREYEVIAQRYALDGTESGDGETLEQVANRLELSRERVRQIEAKAMRKLRSPSSGLRRVIDTL